MTHEVISVAQMRAMDAASPAAGVPTRDLMENAGRAVAEVVMRHWRPTSVAVLCGPGNNGGDGFVAARVLREAGWPVEVACLAPTDALRGDAADAAAQWGARVAPLDTLPDATLYIDALFGAGLSRPLDGEAAAAVRALLERQAPVLAVDVPSGVDADTGKVGGAVVRAERTVTFTRKKAAHVLYPARAFCGDVEVASIGAPEDVVRTHLGSLWENAPDVWRAAFPWPRYDAHKHARGHVMVASGERLRTGAARLAARGALRVGAGLVTVISPLKAAAENAAHLTAIMLDVAEAPRHYSDATTMADCLVIGPAFGTDPRHSERMHAARTTPKRCPIVFDADAITLMAPLKVKLQSRDVLTPHVGEFRRAFPNVLEKSATRIEAVRTAAAMAGCVVLLKGPDTTIAAPDGRAYVNTSGSPHLATAGSGDVLAGFIGGLIAQGTPSLEAALIASWLHGRCGEALGPGLIAEDLPDCVPIALGEIAPQRGWALD